jgi:thioredoxin-like negative regulator of GroEL
MEITNIESIEQAEQHIQFNNALLLYFYNNNCAPCLSLRPKVIELISENFPEMSLYFVNSETSTELAAHFNSFSNPTIILFFAGKEHRRFSKYISIQQMADEIRKPYSLIFG